MKKGHFLVLKFHGKSVIRSCGMEKVCLWGTFLWRSVVKEVLSSVRNVFLLFKKCLNWRFRISLTTAYKVKLIVFEDNLSIFYPLTGRHSHCLPPWHLLQYLYKGPLLMSWNHISSQSMNLTRKLNFYCYYYLVTAAELGRHMQRGSLFASFAMNKCVVCKRLQSATVLCLHCLW